MLGVGGIFSSHLGRFSSCKGVKRGKEEKRKRKEKMRHCTSYVQAKQMKYMCQSDVSYEDEQSRDQQD